MVKRFFLLLLLGSLFSLQAFASVSPIREDFVKLDRHLIGALFFTNQGKQDKAIAEIEKLSEIWNEFKANYYSYAPSDSLWQKDFDNVSSLITEAKEITASGKNLLDAHEKLEKVRTILYELRKRNSINYYLDALIRFHEEMEKIVHPLKGKKPSDVKDELIDKLKVAVQKGIECWDAVEKENLDASLYGFSQQKFQKMNEWIKEEKETLKNLYDALERKQKGKILKFGGNIKKNFQKIFLLFSDLKMPKN